MVSAQIQTFVLSLGEFHSDINRFKLALRDFLVQLKEFSGDNADLYLEEKELEAQRKAQEELDTVVGRDRLPTFDDLDQLVYIRAIVKETLRWHPVGPLGEYHQSLAHLSHSLLPVVCVQVCNIARSRYDSHLVLACMTDLNAEWTLH